MSIPSIIEFTTDPQLLGLSLSDAQETLLRSIYGLPLSTPPVRPVAGVHGPRGVSRSSVQRGHRDCRCTGR